MAWRVFKLFASQTPIESLNSPDLVGHQRGGQCADFNLPSIVSGPCASQNCNTGAKRYFFASRALFEIFHCASAVLTF
jgi:hypothetical protein